MWKLEVVSGLFGYGGVQESLGTLFFVMREKSHADVIVGRRIRLARRQAGLSAAELSEALRISPSQLRRHENGEHRLRPDRLIMLARRLGVPLSFFFSEKA